MRRFALAFFAASVVLLPGCQRGTGSVTGSVNYQGKALKGGSILFHSTEGLQSYTVSIKDDGSYLVPVITAGSYKICVETASIKPDLSYQKSVGAAAAKTKENAPDIPATASNPRTALEARNAKRFTAIPDKYSKPDTTDLALEVKAGEQTFDIDLK